MERTAVIIVAGGRGLRCGGALPKQFALLGGMPVLGRTINRFARALPGAEIVVVLPESHIDFWNNLSARFDVARHRTTAGGEERFDSVKRGIEALRSQPELIAVQDAVRPLVSEELIRRVVKAAARHGAAIPVVAAVDSFREIVSSGEPEAGIEPSRIIDRSRLRIVQTPQIFEACLLRRAYDRERLDSFTDDASVVEADGTPVCLVEGERGNLKITTPEDFTIAEALLAAEEERAAAAGCTE